MRKPRSEDLYPGKLVYYSGTVYRVEWLQDGNVGLVVPGSESTMIYQPYQAGTYTAFSRAQVSVDNPFLWIDEKIPKRETIVTQWVIGDRLLVQSANIKGEVIHLYQACGKVWVKIRTESGEEREFFDSEDLQPLSKVMPSAA